MAPDPSPLLSCPTLLSCPNLFRLLVKNSSHRFCQDIRFRHCQLSSTFLPIWIKIVIAMAGSSNLSGGVPPLPFENAPDGSQESWLGPSQAANRKAESFRVFYDNTCTESQFRNAYNPSNGRASGSESSPKKPQLRPPKGFFSQ
ncbi:hypothetical protein PGT21_014248 [Puccinia graminis f. sp. tritici]|uniref:Uncharacterized protein n=1 Tax=Puccinia graminis f. sp. tritici TaxID=56615 RepID=A0A5B0PQ05_PUCGR|nr:hypothetical protein PGT21_014248 [Puccinia graminis f. sp. tritici]